MKKKIDIITTVGVSVVTNYLKEKNLSSDDWNDWSNKDLKTEDWCDFVETFSSKSSIIHFNKQISNNTSAEIKTILLLDKKFQIGNIHLLHTDTIGGKFAAKILYELLKTKFDDAVKEPTKIDELNLDDANKFERIGFSTLIDYIDHNKTKDTVLNISGGYKALIPFLTIYAQISGLSIYYVYEESDELITINNLPISFDWALLESLRLYLKETINEDDLGEKKEQVLNKLIENHFVYKNNGLYKLSALGKLLKSQFHNSNLRNNILGSYIEYLYYYFYSKNEDYIDVEISSEKYDLGYTYEYKGSTFEYSFANDEKLMFQSKSGDIDLILKSDSEVILVEAKNFNRFIEYNENISKYRPLNEKDEEDYYRKVKAKILAFKKVEEKLPNKFLFLINSIVFEKDNKDYSADNTIRNCLKYFKNKIEEDFYSQIKFEAKLCKFNFIKEKKLEVDYSSLLRKKLTENDFTPINI